MALGEGRTDRRGRRDSGAPVWRQALEGIGLVSLGGLLAVAVGAVMSVAVSWLF